MNVKSITIRKILAASGYGFLILLFLSVQLRAEDDVESDKDPYGEKEVSELAFGKVLFEYFQAKDFRTLTEILIAKQRKSVESHLPELDALQGRLYFRYGLQKKAEQLLKAILSRTTSTQVKSEIYYLLANSRFHLGDIEGAKRYLASSNADPASRFIGERQLLQGTLYLEENDFDSAVAAYSSIGDDSNYAAYARYNQAIAMMGNMQTDAALDILEEIFELNARTEAQKALVDKSAITIAYYLLQTGRNVDARPYLAAVRTSSPYANKALLGLGWSFLNEKQYEEALSPWLTLAEGDTRDFAVQEVYLAIPFALQQLGAYQQALERYLLAIDMITKEQAKVQKVVENVEMGDLIPLLKQAAQEDTSILQRRWKERPINLERTPENYYLQDLIASSSFYSSYREYQDLHHLKRIVESWLKQIPAYTMMISNNKRLYRNKKPMIEQRLSQLDIEAFEKKLGELRLKFQDGARFNDLKAFSRPNEQDYLDIIDSLKKKIPRIKDRGQFLKLQDKLSFLNGVLLWRLNDNFVARRWQAQKSLQKAEAALAELRYRRQQLLNSQEFSANRFAGFDERLDVHRVRLQQLFNKINDLIIRYEVKLNVLAVDELEKRLVILKQFQFQTELAIARLHDRAVSKQEAPSE